MYKKGGRRLVGRKCTTETETQRDGDTEERQRDGDRTDEDSISRLKLHNGQWRQLWFSWGPGPTETIPLLRTAPPHRWNVEEEALGTMCSTAAPPPPPPSLSCSRKQENWWAQKSQSVLHSADGGRGGATPPPDVSKHFQVVS